MSLQEIKPSWFAVYTKPRQERIALEKLKHQGFHCFLPMAVNPYKGRSKRTPLIEPLFPRCLFLSVIAGQQSLGPVRSTRGVCGLVRFGVNLATIPEKVIGTINAKCDPVTGLVQPDPVPVHIGDRVRVFDGPMAGIRGIFREHKGVNRALLLMQMLGTESTVEVDTLLFQNAM